MKDPKILFAVQCGIPSLDMDMYRSGAVGSPLLVYFVQNTFYGPNAKQRC